MTDKLKDVQITEEYIPSVNMKRTTYKSPRISIITEEPADDKNEFGFLQNDIPDYAKID